jgi:hypothetical protein
LKKRKSLENLNLTAGIFKQSLGARNRVGIGLSYRPTRLDSLAEFFSSESILGLLKSLKIRALDSNPGLVSTNSKPNNCSRRLVFTKLVKMAVANHGMPKIIGSTLLSIGSVTFVETKSSRGKSPDYFALKLSRSGRRVNSRFKYRIYV